jgi:hypothetical protein
MDANSEREMDLDRGAQGAEKRGRNFTTKHTNDTKRGRGVGAVE